ncbi:endonuclease/exonuclease/phosphatase family metal-dependent hydrolase [Algoriphagus sp. 4150]|uniref:endonuclease/exonuclease/phosphatase family protein n=1 Tax=Algoriphagus sp. 4150 TaxID=2817756 RepID=UPI002858043B|nr:endonuclease/exonuclease/phosphatase family protein [Algoriphagus sp. 4150]MDR7131013.1 endonuclease/exonuclease/phosphatase family metal-dependent hydrolase [Algoriphagus sp. 4150]
MKIYIIAFLALMAVSAFGQKNPEIKVASYNLRMDTPGDSMNAWPHRKENVKALIRYHDFDIIGTQEGFIHQLNGLLGMPGFAFVGAGRDDGKTAGEHSAIFYKTDRFELLDSGNFWLSETPDKPGLGWDATCCNRIASWALLKDRKSKKEFYVFNAHFDHQGVIARKESGKLMIQKIKEIAKDKPVICTGDFNSTPETEQMIALSAFLNDAYTITEMPPYGPVGTTNAFRFTAPMKNRIDYVFVSEYFKVLKYAVLTDAREQRYPSDHLPVVAAVQFAK